jgi:hypothetical protein
MESPPSYFSGLTDPRVAHIREHSLEDILFIAVVSIIFGAESWYDMEDFGKAREEWLKTFLRLPGGIPSHDTFNRVFPALEPKELEKCFIAWRQAAAALAKGEAVDIDGKSMRGTREQGNKNIVHMVSAWAQENHIALGLVKADEKSNGITAIPRLSNSLVLKVAL